MGPLLIRREGSVAYVTVTRPELRNALDAGLIADLHHAFETFAGDAKIRAVVLAGEGKAFSGGADARWMRDSLELSEEENREDARRLSRMLRAIDRLPKIVIARVQGAALGGGAGLAAVCDIVIAADDALFGFTEVRLGIVPAVISPFVIAKIGRSQARALALTGERFDARRAREIGLVHRVVTEAELDDAVARTVEEARAASPSAVAVTKALLREVAYTGYDESLELTAQAIARQRVSEHGQEGLRAFLEKRPASWTR